MTATCQPIQYKIWNTPISSTQIKLAYAHLEPHSYDSCVTFPCSEDCLDLTAALSSLNSGAGISLDLIHHPDSVVNLLSMATVMLLLHLPSGASLDLQTRKTTLLTRKGEGGGIR